MLGAGGIKGVVIVFASEEKDFDRGLRSADRPAKGPSLLGVCPGKGQPAPEALPFMGGRVAAGFSGSGLPRRDGRRW